MGTDTVEQFVAEWLNEMPFVEAHTSGSTGKPKRITLLKSDMIASAKATCEYFNITDNSLLVCPLSPSYIAGKMMIVRSIVSGAELLMPTPSNRPEISTDSRISLLAVVPSQIDGIMAYCDRVDNLLIGGASVSEIMENRLRTLDCESYVSYGMTETCSHVALRRIKDNDRLYRAMPGVTFDIDDRECLVINAPHLSIGMVVTNDIVKLHNSTSFEWLGRIDNVINTGGMKVLAEDVERRLSTLLDMPFYIAGEEDPKWGTRVTLHIEKERTEADAQKIDDLCRETLRPHERPKKIYFHAALNRTSSGKLKRQD